MTSRFAWYAARSRGSCAASTPRRHASAIMRWSNAPVHRSIDCFASSKREVRAAGALIQAVRNPGASVFEKLLR